MAECTKHKRYKGKGWPRSGCRECLDVHVEYWTGVGQAALDKVTTARAALRSNCSHEIRYTAPYRWEHDNGYGRQRMVDGEYCKACGKEWPWGRKTTQ